MNEYHKLIADIPEYLYKYLDVSCLKRLQDVGYFCGMDYASKNIYDFKYRVTRYDHSLSTSLLTYRFNGPKKAVISALFHDIATPVFSHVIDYMNNDYVKQESTEEKTEEIIMNDKKLLSLLKEDNIQVEDIINFKNYSLVDLERPMLCTDRIDGIFLSSLAWTKKLNLDDVKNILNKLRVYLNENNKLEIGTNKDIAMFLIELEEEINRYTHSYYDSYMMDLLAKMTKYVMDNKLIVYNDLFKLKEMDMIKIFTYLSLYDDDFYELFNKFKYIKKEDIQVGDFPEIKKRVINPLIDNGTRVF